MYLKQRHHITRARMLPLMLSLLAACGQQTPGQSVGTLTQPQQEQAASTSQPSTQADGEILGTIEIHALDMSFKPSEITVDKPGRYTLTLVNDGAVIHNVTLADGTQVVANAGETSSIEVDVAAEGIAFVCSVPGHEAAGMKGRMSVAPAAGAGH